MAYVKTTWETGDVITAEKLNNAEGGIENATPLYVDIETQDGETYTASESMSTIGAAMQAGRIVILRDMVDFHGSCIASGDSGEVHGAIPRVTYEGETASSIEVTQIIISIGLEPTDPDIVTYRYAAVALS